MKLYLQTIFPIVLLSLVNENTVAGAENTTQFEDHATIIRSVKQFIRRHVQKMHQGEFTIRVGQLDPRHRLRRCSKPLETSITGNNPGSTSMTVAVRCTGTSPWLLYVPGKVSMFKQIFIARQTMSRGHRITAGDLQSIRRDIGQLQFGYIDKKRDVIGKITKRVVFANSVIRPQMLSLPLLVKRGQTVVLMAESNGIQVRMSGKALGSAPAGQTIRVRNLSSRRIVEGVVVRSGVVKISM